MTPRETLHAMTASKISAADALAMKSKARPVAVAALLAVLLAPCGVMGAELKFATGAESRAEFERVVKPFFAKHCATCHNDRKAKGDLNLADLDPDMKASTSGARWAKLVQSLTEGDMPPEEKPRPETAGIEAVIRWAHAEAKRANKHFAKRESYANGNAVPHEVLFNPASIPPFDASQRVRRLSPEIYAAAFLDKGRAKGVSQPFSGEGRTTFKDMGAPKMDEPVTMQLLQNALAIVEARTAHTVEDGKFKAAGNTPRELVDRKSVV